MGMILYKRTDTSVVCDLKEQYIHIDEKTQTIQCYLNGIPVCFTYIHPECVSTGLRKLEEITLSDVIIGDLNVNYLQPVGHERITKFCKDNHLVVSFIGPTHNNARLDHVLMSSAIAERIYYHVQSLFNLYSGP